MTKVVAALLVPVVLWYLGDARRKEDTIRQDAVQRAEVAQRQADRVTLLMRYFASAVPRERVAGLKISEYLARSQQFPAELMPVVAEIARNDEDITARQVAVSTLRTDVTRDVATAKGPEGPPRIASLSDSARRAFRMSGLQAAASRRDTNEVIADAVVTAVTGSQSNGFVDRAVLWVDDRPANNLDLIAAFTKLGIRVDTVLSTDAGLRAVSQRRYSAILSDVSRGADGRAGLTFLDSLNRRRITAPLLFYSAVTDERIAEARQRGAVGVTNVPSAVFAFVTSVIGDARSATP